jgi:hypothetical protein
MTDSLRDQLRNVIGVAFRMAPKPLREAVASKALDEKTEAARKELSYSVADAVTQHFEVRKKPYPGPHDSAHTQHMERRPSGSE